MARNEREDTPSIDTAEERFERPAGSRRAEPEGDAGPRAAASSSADQQADKPTDLPKGAWKATGKRAFNEFRDDNMLDAAAALTYYGVLSIFPALALLVGLISLIGQHPETTNALLNIIGQFAPQTTVQALSGAVESAIRSGGVLAVVLGLLGALWTASGYLGAFFRASNTIYEVPEGRSFFKLRPLQMALTVLLLIVVAFGATVFVATGSIAQAIGDQIGVGDAAVTAWQIAKWPALALLVAVMFALLYYLAPNVEQPKFRWVTPGGAIGLGVWIIASAGFAFYVSNFGSYGKTYGALAGAVILLVWLWVSNIALLFGAEFDAELERERKIRGGMRPKDKEPFLPLREEPDDS